MCRHLGWLGEPVSIGSLMLDPPHGLKVQSYAPRRQKFGLLNADGWGVGFYPTASAEQRVCRWRSASPLWSDASFASVAPELRSGCVVAAVRSATIGMPIESSASAPFTDGHWLLSHNGIIDRSVVPPARGVESTVDSAVLAAHIFEVGPAALGDIVVELGDRDPGARLNLLAASGSRLLATTWGDGLWALRRPDGVVLASEPYDDHPDWEDIPDRHLVEVSDGRMSITPL